MQDRRLGYHEPASRPLRQKYKENGACPPNKLPSCVIVAFVHFHKKLLPNSPKGSSIPPGSLTSTTLLPSSPERLQGKDDGIWVCATYVEI